MIGSTQPGWFLYDLEIMRQKLTRKISKPSILNKKKSSREKACMLMREFDAGDDIYLDLNKGGLTLENRKKCLKKSSLKIRGNNKVSCKSNRKKSKTNDSAMSKRRNDRNYVQSKYKNNQVKHIPNERKGKNMDVALKPIAKKKSTNLNSNSNLSQFQSYLLRSSPTNSEEISQYDSFYSATKKEIIERSKTPYYFQYFLYEASCSKCLD